MSLAALGFFLQVLDGGLFFKVNRCWYAVHHDDLQLDFDLEFRVKEWQPFAAFLLCLLSVLNIVEFEHDFVSAMRPTESSD